MPRIPYRTDDQAGTGDLVNAIRKRRGGTLLSVIAAYNMVSRFLVALGVEPEA